MRKSRKFITGVVLGLLALAMAAGIGFTAFTASAAPASQTTPQPAPTTTTTPATRSGKELRESFIKYFTSRLGVDEAKLNAAFSGAVSDTVDQAVKDGKLTQAQADKIKEAAKNGFKGGPFNGHLGDKGKIGDGQNFNGLQNFVDAAAKPLGLTADQLKAELKAGKSLADIAKAKNVDIQKVKDSVLAEVKTQLDARVKDGKLTQAQADQLYQRLSSGIDQFINGGGRGRK